MKEALIIGVIIILVIMVIELVKIYRTSLTRRERKEIFSLITKMLSHKMTNNSTEN